MTLGQQYAFPVGLSLLVHVLVIGSLLVKWNFGEERHQMLLAPPSLPAKLVEMTAKTPKKAPPKEKKSKPKEEKKPDKPKDEPKEKPKEKQRTNEKTKAKVEPKQEPEPEIDHQEELDRALEQEANQLDALASEDLVASYADNIRRMVEQSWHRPPSARNGMEAELFIELVPTGEIVDVQIVRSSGDAAFDRSALSAVHDVRRFEVPEDIATFEEKFRKFRFLFRPEDLIR